MSAARDPRALLRRARSRYRRPLAAVLAALATIVAISALRPPSAPEASEAIPSAPLGRSGDVMVPVPLAIGGSAVSAGDVVDLVAVDEAGIAQIIASDVVITESESSTGYSTDAVVLMAMSEPDALNVTAAAERAPLAVIIHSDASRSG